MSTVSSPDLFPNCEDKPLCKMPHPSAPSRHSATYSGSIVITMHHVRLVMVGLYTSRGHGHLAGIALCTYSCAHETHKNTHANEHRKE